MSAASKRNGTRTYGSGGSPAGQQTGHLAGGHTPARRKTARWVGKAVPAAAIAAALAAGAATYGATGTSHPDPGKLAGAATATASTTAFTTFTCSGGGGMLPENVTAIVNFLIHSGYSRNAVAGIAGNIYQESGGNPEAVGMGGGGLIGFTPLPSGYVTGNPATDLQRQLAAVLTYNQIWSSYIPALNAAATPAQAASIYVTDFERAGIPAASTREASAQAVASACGL